MGCVQSVKWICATLCSAALLAACGSGAGDGEPAPADPPIYPPSYGSNGVFGVVGTTDARATSHIPPGTYRVDQAPGMYPGQSPPGFWVRCHDFPCGPGYPANVIATGAPAPDTAAFMQILPTDTAVALYNVTLTLAG